MAHQVHFTGRPSIEQLLGKSDAVEAVGSSLDMPLAVFKGDRQVRGQQGIEVQGR